MALWIARVLLAVVFGVAGTAKFADRAGVRRAIVEFGLPARIAAPLGWVLVSCELGVALALLFESVATGGAFGALVVLLGFSVAIAVNLAHGRTPDCHCFGRLHSAPVGWETVARNGLLASIAGFVAADGRLPTVFAGLGVVAACLWVGLGLRRSWRRRLGATVPSFSLPDETGRTWTLDGLLAERRPLLLVFSHPACAACNALLPEVAGWQAGLDGRMTVAVVSGGPREENLVKAREYGLRRLLVDEGRTVSAAYGVTATPSAVLIERDGTLAAAPARGAGEILALVARVTEAPERTTFARRALLGRAALGLPMAAFLPAFVSRRGAAAAGRSAQASETAKGGAGSVCFQRYALCTSAPCEPSPTDPSIVVCRCFIEDGPSFGNTSCEQRAPAGNTLYSAFSLQNITSSSTFMTCPAGSPWANCLDVVCTVDPSNPTQALCQCQTVLTGSFITFGGNCDTATCTSVIWSAASADMIEQGVSAYTTAVQPTGMPVSLPANCA